VDPERERKINKIIMDRLNPAPKPMGLEEFAEFRLAVSKDRKYLTLRHHGCPDHHVEKIELMEPFMETNVKWLMLRATVHWQEVHSNGD
jgi:hypothetical protein